MMTWLMLRLVWWSSVDVKMTATHLHLHRLPLGVDTTEIVVTRTLGRAIRCQTKDRPLIWRLSPNYCKDRRACPVLSVVMDVPTPASSPTTQQLRWIAKSKDALTSTLVLESLSGTSSSQTPPRRTLRHHHRSSMPHSYSQHSTPLRISSMFAVHRLYQSLDKAVGLVSCNHSFSA